MRIDCPHGADAAAFLADELTARERDFFEAHLAECAECRASVASTERVLDRLRGLPRLAVTGDLAPAILAELTGARAMPEAPPRPWWRTIAASAAAAAILVAGGYYAFHHLSQPAFAPPSHSVRPTLAPETPQPALAVAAENSAGIKRALDWLHEKQEPDGSWNPEKWGGHRNFGVALTALPALALLRAEAVPSGHASAIVSATQWLQKQQSPAGAFGPEFQGQPYNHSIATLALLHAYGRQPEPGLKKSLDGALEVLAARQTEAGGWGYLHSPLADRSITEWHVEAMDLAVSLGWEKLRPALVRAHEWLAGHPTARPDSEEPPDSPSALLAQNPVASAGNPEDLDFYRAYFLTAALQREHNASSEKTLAAVRHTLLEHQVAGGAESGSWPPDDRWGRAGGRLYATALASLSLADR